MDLSKLLQESFYYIRHNKMDSLHQNIDKKTKMIKNYFDKQFELRYFEKAIEKISFTRTK